MQGMGYRTVKEHMEDLFQFLDRLLYAAFCQKRGSDYENLSMRGLVITEKEIEQAFGHLRRSESLPEGESAELIGRSIEIERKEMRTEIFLPFFSICHDFELNTLEKLSFLVAAAPCFHRKYDKIYGYLQDQVDLLLPTRGLCLSLAKLTGEEIPEEDEAEFLAGGGNLELLLGTGEGRKRGLEGTIRLNQRIQNYLHGNADPEPCIQARLSIFNWLDSPEPMLIREDRFLQMENLLDELEEDNEESVMVLFCGKEGIGKRFLLRHLAVRRQRFLLCFDMKGLLYEKAEKVKELLEAVILEAVLSSGLICLEGLETGQEGEEGARVNTGCRREILTFMSRRVPCFFVTAEEKEDLTAEFPGKKICIELPALSAGEKIRLWKAFGWEYDLGEDVDLEENGNKYVLTPRGIRDALATAQLLAYAEGTEKICQEHIRQAVRQNQKNQLGAYATLINSQFGWDDLILGEEQKRQMRLVCDQMKYRDVVGEKWGFYKKTPYGRGLSVLFYGPPGTGKTMAAQVMASELCLDLYRIELSAVVSKYIGETEKNLEEIFEQAAKSQVILFFDEADVLFSKRTEVRDSNDKYSNMEAAFLLQKMEEYEGITVLATNFLQNFDEAFKRRMKFIIDFPFPGPEQRKQIWQQAFPEQTPVDGELDFDFLAGAFELSGSNIKNAAFHAAFLAADASETVSMRHLIAGIRNEYEKSGKILSREQLGQYYMLLEV